MLFYSFQRHNLFASIRKQMLTYHLIYPEYGMLKSAVTIFFAHFQKYFAIHTPTH